MTWKRHQLAAGLAVALLAGCSLTQPPIEADVAEEAAAVPETPAQPSPGIAMPDVKQVHPAAAQFLADARNWLKLGNTARAAASLERAIRIDPRHPEPWLKLAQLRYDGGDMEQAENLALKARSLAPRDSEWFETAESLLVEISMLPR